MKELTLNELPLISGMGRATGTTGLQLSASCSDGMLWGTIGGALAGSSAGLLGAALGAAGGFIGGAGAGGCFTFPKPAMQK